MPLGTAPHKNPISGQWETRDGRVLSEAGQRYWENLHQQGGVDLTGHTPGGRVRTQRKIVQTRVARARATPTPQTVTSANKAIKTLNQLSGAERQAYYRRELANPKPDHQRDLQLLGFEGASMLDQARKSFQTNVRQTLPVRHEVKPPQPSQLETALAFAASQGQVDQNRPDVQAAIKKVRAYNKAGSRGLGSIGHFLYSSTVDPLWHLTKSAALSVGGAQVGAPQAQVVSPEQQRRLRAMGAADPVMAALVKDPLVRSATAISHGHAPNGMDVLSLGLLLPGTGIGRVAVRPLLGRAIARDITEAQVAEASRLASARAGQEINLTREQAVKFFKDNPRAFIRPRTFNVGTGENAISVSIPAARSITGRALERAVDKARPLLSKIPGVKTESERAYAELGHRIRRQNMGSRAAVDLLTKYGRKLNLEEEYALMHVLQGTPPSMKLAFHKTMASTLRNETYQGYHAIHAAYTEEASKYLTMKTLSPAEKDARAQALGIDVSRIPDQVVALSPDAPPILHKALDAYLRVARGREDIYTAMTQALEQGVNEDVASNVLGLETRFAERKQLPGRIMQGARARTFEQQITDRMMASPGRARLEELVQRALPPEQQNMGMAFLDTIVRNQARKGVPVEDIYGRIASTEFGAPPLVGKQHVDTLFQQAASTDQAAQAFFKSTAKELYDHPGKPFNAKSKPRIEALLNDLRERALEAEAWKAWYVESSHAILQHVGGDVNEAIKLAKLLAIYSPRAKVWDETQWNNITRAIGAYDEFKQNGYVSDHWSISKPSDKYWQQAEYARQTGTTAPPPPRRDWQTEAANGIMRGEPGLGAGGRKINAFAQTFVKQFAPERMVAEFGRDIPETVQDTWMRRAFGFPATKAKTGSKVGKLQENISDEMYSFMNDATEAVAQSLGWSGHEAQAAIWTSIKAEMEGTPLSEAGFSFSDALKAYRERQAAAPQHLFQEEPPPLRRPGEPVNWKQQAQEGVTFDRNTGQVASEAIPQEQVWPQLNEKYKALPPEAQAAYAREMHDAVQGRFERILGLESKGMHEGPGVWRDEVNPGAAAHVSMPQAEITPELEKDMQALSAAHGLSKLQGSVSWGRPLAEGSDRGFQAFHWSGDPSIDLGQLSNTLDETFGPGLVGVVHAPDGGFYIVNFGDVPDFATVAGKLPGSKQHLRWEGNYTIDHRIKTEDWETTFEDAINSHPKAAELRDELANVRRDTEPIIESYLGVPAARVVSKEEIASLEGTHVLHGTTPEIAASIMKERRLRVGHSQPEGAWTTTNPEQAAWFEQGATVGIPKERIPEGKAYAPHPFGNYGSPEDIVFQTNKGDPQWMARPYQVKGWTSFQTHDAIVGLTDVGDLSTLMHEFTHVLRRFGLAPKQEAALARAIGVPAIKDKTGQVIGYEWTRATEEKFAEGMEAWVARGTGPQGADALMTQLAPVLREIYKGSDMAQANMSPAFARFVNRLFKSKPLKGQSIVGAEGWGGALAYAPHLPGDPTVRVSDAQNAFAHFIRSKGDPALITRHGQAIGAGPQDAALLKQYLGGLELTGEYTPDVILPMVKRYMVAQKVKTFREMKDFMVKAGTDLPQRADDIPIWESEIKGKAKAESTDSLRHLYDKLAAHDPQASLEAIAKKYSNDLDTVTAKAMQDFKDSTFDLKEINGEPVEDVIKRLSAPGAEPIPGLKWVSRDEVAASHFLAKPLMIDVATSGLGKAARQVLTAGGIGYDAVNDIQKAMILYLNPAYYPVNLLGNLSMNLMQQGVFMGPNLWRAVQMHWSVTPWERTYIDHLMGSGLVESMASASHLGEMAHTVIGSRANAIIDLIPRRASFLHEARRAGYKLDPKTGDFDLRKLLQDAESGHEGAKQQLDMIVARAKDAIVDYDRMGPLEKQVFRRIIFFYPWLRGSTRYTFRFIAEHPAQAMTIALMYEHAKAQADAKLGKRPYYASLVFPISTETVGLKVPFTGADVGLDKVVGTHAWKQAGLPMTFSLRQLLTPASTLEVFGDSISFLSGMDRASAGAMASHLVPVLAAGETALTGYDPFKNKEVGRGVPQFFKQLGPLQTPVAGDIAKIRMSEEERAKKNKSALYPRTKAQEIERTGLGSLAPTPYNPETGQGMARKSASTETQRRENLTIKAKKAHVAAPSDKVKEELHWITQLDKQIRTNDSAFDKLKKAQDVYEKATGHRFDAQPATEGQAERLYSLVRHLLAPNYEAYNRIVNSRTRKQKALTPAGS